MDTYYDMLADGPKLALADCWEELEETARAGQALLGRCPELGWLPAQPVAALRDAMADPAVALALAEPGCGGEPMFEDEADAAGASGPEEPESASARVAWRAGSAREAVRRAAAGVLGAAEARMAEAAGLLDLAAGASA